MHIGFVCPQSPGHLNPSLALARELSRRGHRLTMLTGPPVRATVESAGLEIVPIGEQEDADGRTAASFDRLGRLSGAAAAIYTGVLMRVWQEILVRDLPTAIESSGIDALIVDQAASAGAVVAERLSLPYVVACNALAMCHDDAHPPAPLLWRYRRGAVWRLRNRAASTWLLPLFNAVAGMKRGGVSPVMLLFECHRGLAIVAQQPAFLDFPRSAAPDHLHYTGPWHASGRDDEVPFPWERLDGRPLVYASLGTIQNRRRHVFAAIAEAVRGLDLQLVLALGRPSAPVDLDLPENVLAVPYAPQLRLLDRAAVAITHAGMNTALECLSRGVPMVCLPITNDQPGVARRVEWVGAGEVLSVGRINAARLRRSLLRVLNEPHYREAARRCRDEIAALKGTEMAADVIERAFARRERVRRADVAS